MERIAYPRLFSTVAGLLLAMLGLFGFLVSAEFRNPELTSDLLGLYPVNGWANSFHLVAGLIGLGLARPLPRLYALLAGVAFAALGVWGIAAPNGELLFGWLPATRSVNLVNLAIGLLGLAALAASRWDRITSALSTWASRFRRNRERRSRRRRERKLRERRKRTSPAAGRRSRPSSSSGRGGGTRPGSKRP